jgi:hypothetical protein
LVQIFLVKKYPRERTIYSFEGDWAAKLDILFLKTLIINKILNFNMKICGIALILYLLSINKNQMKSIIQIIILSTIIISCKTNKKESVNPKFEFEISKINKEYFLTNPENIFYTKFNTDIFKIATLDLNQKTSITFDAVNLCNQILFKMKTKALSNNQFEIEAFDYQNTTFTGNGKFVDGIINYELVDKSGSKYQFEGTINSQKPSINSLNKSSIKSTDTLLVFGKNFGADSKKYKIEIEGYETNLIQTTDTLIKVALKKTETITDSFTLKLIKENCFELEYSEKLSLQKDIWKKSSMLPGPTRWYSIALTMGKYVYLGTGINDSRKRLSDFYRFDPSNNTWKEMAGYIGGAVNSGVAFAIGDTAYVGTGHNGNESVSTFFKYVASENKWSEIAKFPGGEREHAVAFTIGNKGYVAIGKNRTIYFNDLWEYDPSLNKWTQKRSNPGVGTAFSFAFVHNGKAYFGPGLNRSSIFISDFWEYDPKTDTYKSMPPFLAIEPEHFQIGKYGYVVYNNGQSMSRFDLEKYTWEKLTPPYNYLVTHGVGFSFGNKGYHGTGFSGIYSNEFLEYTP